MDEYIDILTKEGKPTGKSELKSVIHQKGFFHHTTHIWLYTKRGDILLSQRSVKKLICPLLWDVSVAGHVDAGEAVVQAAIRETKEEIDLTITESDLKKIGVFECFQDYQNGLKDYEFHNTFICELKVPSSLLTPQPNEVESLKLVTLSEFEELLENSGNNNHFVSSNRAYYNIVLSAIEKEVVSKTK